ncbi:UDP-N-acetylglucosamine 1-carboxyvinyltransferase [Anaerocolumna xylanovorans]|uniref:UDP-N-acetylglucosamine 1-carboxyvinyltransferase n=1 Tax=Anaerocolumna xylanovorans DSM 12503 TaxID=1121345 RepID=A0A1M7YBQ1_9FIRM|nr:UDP-N-acetylglucosamine 1-carboxyvinyltransferase [Anaerocolumna xylanovorans]SHO49948.1 UDP-N-acetylglucosamine 1-carboxyvinyltransferase [Anaerocolumna xylanovorans DSM 12503]
MTYIEIMGGKKLNGEVNIQGSKNTVLPILAATLLINGITKLNHCPKILDVEHMIKILIEIGCSVTWEDSSIIVDTRGLNTEVVPTELVKKMRSSIILLGALLGRSHHAVVSYPGGCTIGARPINFHLDAFQKMNVALEEEDGLVKCVTSGIKGADIYFPSPSVGATENVILAGTLGFGKTRIFNAAREPEILELCKFLNSAGAKIYGAGTSRIEIEGVASLHQTEYSAPSDRIVAGTYLAAAAGTGGEVTLKGIGCGSLSTVIQTLRKMGSHIKCGQDSITIRSGGNVTAIPEIKTAPYPGFPTDMQSQIMSVLMKASGSSKIVEEIFEGRYQNVPEQARFGAQICLHDREAYITGVPVLKASEVSAGELRGGAALVIAGLMAEGKTIVKNPYHIQRGYEDICRDLRTLGAQIDYKEEN